MWKKIGIKNDSPTDSGVKTYQRVRALDEKQVIERDGSTGKLSGSSSKMSKSGSQASHRANAIQGNAQIQQKISLFYGQSNQQHIPLTPKAIFGLSPKGDKNQMTFEQLASKFSSGQSHAAGQSFEKSLRRPDARFSDHHDQPNESQFVKESSASFVDDLQLIPITNNSRMMQDYIERLQHSLRASRKANHVYESKLKQIKFQMGQMKKQVRRQLQHFKSQMKATSRSVLSRLDIRMPSQMMEQAVELQLPTERTVTDLGGEEQGLNIIFTKIEQLREDLRGSNDLKKNIISRLDDNLKKLGETRRHRAKIAI